MLKKYVQFLYFTVMYDPKEKECQVKDGDRSKLDIPENVPALSYGYRFFAREEVQKHGETLYGKRRYEDGITYFGHIMTLEEFKQELSGDWYFKSRMDYLTAHPEKKMVKTRMGKVKLLNLEDRVIETDTPIDGLL